MTPTEKAKGINLEVMQDSIRDARNKSIGNDAVCSTAAGTAAKTVTLGTTFELVTKATIIVKFENAITVAGATLNITHTDLAGQTSSTGAKDIYYRGAALPANLVKAGMSLIMRYNGTQWDIISNIEALDDYLQVNAQNFSNAQKLQARTNIGAQENVTDMAKLGCGIGTCSTDSGTALIVSLTDYELVKNGHVAVTFEHDVPAGATLNINGKGAKPIIYKGAAIEADTIKADDTVMFCFDGTNYVVTSLGGGGGGTSVLKETVTISLSQENGNNADLIGATIIITDDDSSETLLSATWQGIDIEAEIESNVNYTITVGSITGYMTPDSQSYQAIPTYIRSVVFTYNNNLGIYIESIDHKLYTASQWASVGKLPNSVVILTSTHQTRYAVTGIKTMQIHNDSWWSGADTYLVARGSTPSFDGKTDTDKLIALNTAKGTNNTSYAAPYAKAYVFPDGVGGSYFMSSGQALSLYNNATEVLACYGALGVSVSFNNLWTTTCYDYSGTGTMCFIDGAIRSSAPYESRLVIPVRDYINN